MGRVSHRRLEITHISSALLQTSMTFQVHMYEVGLDRFVLAKVPVDLVKRTLSPRKMEAEDYLCRWSFAFTLPSSSTVLVVESTPSNVLAFVHMTLRVSNLQMLWSIRGKLVSAPYLLDRNRCGGEPTPGRFVN
jgi:hypothetical protein